MGQQVLVPCGKCPRCKAARVSSWSFRLMQEQKVAKTALFITLTYDHESLPITKNGYPSLCKRDLQLFFKRLRYEDCKSKGVSASAIKYFAVGEYGGKIGRPHYHVLLFNADIKKIQTAWRTHQYVHSRCEHTNSRCNGQDHTKRNRKVWHDMGYVHYGDQRGVSEASVGYCLKYILDDGKMVLKEKLDDSADQFAVMSKGLGAAYLNQAMLRWHHADLKNRMYVNIGEGKKAAMPRYYKNRLYTEAERKAIAESSRDNFVEKILDDLFKLYVSDTDYVRTYQKRKRNEREAEEAQYRKQIQKQFKRKNYA